VRWCGSEMNEKFVIDGTRGMYMTSKKKFPTRNVTLYVREGSHAIFEAAKQKAADEHKSLSDVVLELLKTYVDGYTPQTIRIEDIERKLKEVEERVDLLEQDR
jgi:Mg2+ and Co2+ transporter CorA